MKMDEKARLLRKYAESDDTSPIRGYSIALCDFFKFNGHMRLETLDCICGEIESVLKYYQDNYELNCVNGVSVLFDKKDKALSHKTKIVKCSHSDKCRESDICGGAIPHIYKEKECSICIFIPSSECLPVERD